MGYLNRGGETEGLITVSSTNSSGQETPSLVSPHQKIYLVQSVDTDPVDNGGLTLNGKRFGLVGTLSFFTLLSIAGCAETASNRGGVKVQSIGEGLWGEIPKSIVQDQNAVPAGQIQIGDVANFSGKNWVLQPNDTGFSLGAKLRAVNPDGSESYMYVPAKSVEQKGKQFVFVPETQAVVWTGILKSGDKVFTISEVETANFARSEVDILGEVSADSLRLGTAQLSVQMLGEDREALLNIPASYLGRASSLTVGMTFEDVKDYLSFGQEEQVYLKTYYDQLAAFDKKAQEQAAAQTTATPNVSPTAVATATAADANMDRGNGQHTAIQASPLDGLVKLVDSYKVESAMVLFAVVVLAIVTALSIKTNRDRKAAEAKDAAAEKKLKEAAAREKKAAEDRALAIQGLEAITELSDELVDGAGHLDAGVDEFKRSSVRAGQVMGAMTATIAIEAGAAGVRAGDQSIRAKERAKKIKAAATTTRQKIS